MNFLLALVSGHNLSCRTSLLALLWLDVACLCDFQDVVKENGMMVKESLGDLKRLNINALELANSTQEQPKPNSLSTFKHI